MRTVKVQRPAADKHAAIRLGNREVADVFADLRKGALQQRTIARERVHQVVDVGGVLQQCLTHQHGWPPQSHVSSQLCLSSSLLYVLPLSRERYAPARA